MEVITNMTNTTDNVQIIQRATLDGTTSLKIEKIEVTIKMVPRPTINGIPSKPIQERSEKVLETLEFPLTEVSIEELKEYRKNKIPSFLLKLKENFYYTKLPAKINLFACNNLGKHKCSFGTETCNRISTASDENGGCAKVRDRSVGIEKYPFITAGYETFNTPHDSFIVVRCNHFEECPPRKPLSSL